MTTDKINVTLEWREDGGLRVHSSDLPGLILSGNDPAKVAADIIPAWVTLRAHTPAPPPHTNSAIAEILTLVDHYVSAVVHCYQADRHTWSKADTDRNAALDALKGRLEQTIPPA